MKTKARKTQGLAHPILAAWTVCAIVGTVGETVGGGARTAGAGEAAADRGGVGLDLWLVARGADGRGAVITMDPARPTSEAVGVAGGRIVYVGREGGLPGRWMINGQTRVVRLTGQPFGVVLPGLADAHAHLVGLGRALGEVDLRGLTSTAAIRERVRAQGSGEGQAAGGAGPGSQVVSGRGWDQNLFAGGALPSVADRRALDAVSGDRLVVLRRIDGHALWANSAALRRGGIDAKGVRTADPPGGRILRGDDGAPTGVLIDNAMSLIEDKLPAATDAQIAEAIVRGARYVTQRGLTAVHEMGLSAQEVAVYRGLAQQGKLPLRVFGYLADPIPATLSRDVGQAAYQKALVQLRVQLGEAGEDVKGRFGVRGIKLFMDGALGSRGAALEAPYSDDPGSRGLLLSPVEHIEAMARLVLETPRRNGPGWQLATHAIGDRGSRLVLDAYERAGVRAERGARFRLEHAQVLWPADLASRRLARLGVIASVQPTHATSDMGWAKKRLGAQRMDTAYAWQSILAAGGRLCAGSDFPVEEADPRLGLHAAMTRMDTALGPPGGFLAHERLTPGEAIRAFTTEAAYAVFEEDRLGMIAVGRPADLTVLGGASTGWLTDTDSAPPGDLPTREVLLTMVEGVVVQDGLPQKGTGTREKAGR